MMKFYLSEEQIVPLYTPKGNAGCMASNRITVDGSPVGYMYREEPSHGFPDSGWRFFAGDEDEEYTDDPNHFHVFHLNTICNYDRAILPYLEAPCSSAFVRDGDRFVLDD